jgi:CMP/dCMP kinase
MHHHRTLSAASRSLLDPALGRVVRCCVGRTKTTMASSSTSSSFVIAVDGPAASGKGTLARKLAEHFGFRYLDTGSLYRRVGVAAQRSNVSLEDANAVAAVARGLHDAPLLSEAELRTPAAAQAASRVSALPAVRAALLQAQRDFADAGAGGGAVLDGRDIGTVVFRPAQAKLFVTASAEVRARRRYEELMRSGGGDPLSLDQVLADLRERDARDAERAVAPLRPAEDARVLDTTALDAEQAFEAARVYVEERRAAWLSDRE